MMTGKAGYHVRAKERCSMKGQLFNIQRFSVHDGPGIRTTVFLKGCNLRCIWCHNPESYLEQFQIQYFPDKCEECGMCGQVCPEGIHVKNKCRIGTDACILCGRCADACLHDALKLSGEEKTVEDIMNTVRKDKRYYENSAGGLTVSGGEPMLQWEFVRDLMRAAKEEGIHTALDTAGNVPFAWFEAVLPFVDLVLLDIKIMDSALHKKYTGVDNRLILENARRIFESQKTVNIRVPVMRGVNDDLQNARELRDFIKEYPHVEAVNLLPYHNLGMRKAESIGLEMKSFEPPDESRLEELRQILGKQQEDLHKEG